MKSRNLGLLAVALLAGPLAANAVEVTYGGDTYEVTSVECVFASCAPDPTAMRWWGDEGAAVFFAESVGDLLGTPNPYPFGGSFAPFFVFADSTILEIKAYYTETSTVINVGANASNAWWFALARRVEAPDPGTVPEPGTLALFGLGLAGLALSRRRRAN